MHSLRRFRHDRVSSLLAARNDDELAAVLRAAPANAVGVGGGSAVLDVDGVPVFAKRIPITDRELGHPQSTANLFDLPTYCQAPAAARMNDFCLRLFEGDIHAAYPAA